MAEVKQVSAWKDYQLIGQDGLVEEGYTGLLVRRASTLGV